MNSILENIRGIIIPTDWNISGRPIEASLFTKDENEYVIEDTKIGRELLHFLRQQVVISGYLSERDGTKIVEVADFSILCTEEEGKLS